MPAWRKLFVLLFASFSLLVSAQSEGRADDRTTIRDVISRQLEAFKRNDGVEAYSYASPTIQKMFRSPDNFMSMVRKQYAPVYRPADVQFRNLETVGRSLVQRVFIRGADGEAVIANYFMSRMPDGSWRINGCQIERLPEVSA